VVGSRRERRLSILDRARCSDILKAEGKICGGEIVNANLSLMPW